MNDHRVPEMGRAVLSPRGIILEEERDEIPTAFGGWGMLDDVLARGFPMQLSRGFPQRLSLDHVLIHHDNDAQATVSITSHTATSAAISSPPEEDPFFTTQRG